MLMNTIVCFKGVSAVAHCLKGAKSVGEKYSMCLKTKIFKDEEIAGKAYHLGLTEYEDNRKSDVIYIPKDNKTSNRTPPILFEIQHIVDLSFIKRLTRYCLNLHDTYKFKPLVVVFATQGFSSRNFREENFLKDSQNDYYTCKQDLWAQGCKFYNLDSIAESVRENPKHMPPIIALTYFLCPQQRSLIGLVENKDKTLHKIYLTANESFNEYHGSELNRADQHRQVTTNVKNQFMKLLACANEFQKEGKMSILQNLKKYTEYGLRYVEKNLDADEEITVTPVERTISADLFYVEEKRQRYGHRFRWLPCYEGGASIDLEVIFNHLDRFYVNPITNYALYPFKKYFEMQLAHSYPISNYLERDVIRRIWGFIGEAFDTSKLEFSSELSSYASASEKNKKRKIACNSKMERQSNADIPDMLVYFGRYELGIAEVGKEDLDTTKALNDELKMASTMKSMLLNLSEHCQSTDVTIEGMIMSGLTIKFCHMRNPKGYVCVLSEMEKHFFPILPEELLKEMVPLLKKVWLNRLAMEAQLKAVARGQPSSDILPRFF